MAAASSQESADFQLNVDFNFEAFLSEVVGSLNIDEIENEQEDKDKPMWNACILWDSQVCEELKEHDAFQRKLHSTLYLGRLMSLRLLPSDELAQGDFPGIAAMNWRKQFIMVDIVNNDFGTCGVNRCLRVQQTVSCNSPKIQGKPAMWDLVIFNQCESLGNEMVRRFNDGVKTTLIIWGASVSNYDPPWIDYGYHVKGEILLKPTEKNGDALSVLIFHREVISEKRRLRILRAGKDSELWNDFQDEGQHFSWFGYSSRKERQVVFHVMKRYQKKGEGEMASASSSTKCSPLFAESDLNAEVNDNLNQLFAEMEY